MALRKPLKAIHHTFVGPNNHLKVVELQATLIDSVEAFLAEFTSYPDGSPIRLANGVTPYFNSSDDGYNCSLGMKVLAFMPGVQCWTCPESNLPPCKIGD